MSHDLSTVSEECERDKYEDEMEASGLMVERACHRKMTKQWLEEKAVADSKRAQTTRRVQIGKEHHKARSADASGKTIADFEAEFKQCLSMRKTALGAAKKLSKETGGAFTVEAIRKYAKRHAWTTGQS